jgi:preprotein translocase subunit SecB
MAVAPASPAPEPGLLLKTQYIKDLSFENPRAPEIFHALKQAPQVTVNIDVTARPLPPTDDYEVVLAINAEAKTEDQVVFVVELAYAAVFQLSGLPRESLQPILLIEIPRLIFPFARNVVADVTRDSGFPPLLIQPIDFVALYRQKFESAPAA